MTSRLLIAGAAALTLSACLGSSVTTTGGKKNKDGGTSSDSPDMAIDPRAEFNSKVLPLLTQDCGQCHAQSGGSFPPFLVAATGGTVYDTFVAWPNLVGVTPATSQILTQPTHEGPSYADGTTATIKSHVAVISQWITDYNAAGGNSILGDGGMLEITTPTLPQMGVLNTVDLGQLGTAFAGMKLTYTPSMVGTSLIKLQDVTLDASATATGLSVAGTVVAFYNATDLKNTESIDTDFNTDTFTAYGMGTGLMGTTIPAYSSGQYIGFSFTSVTSVMGMPDMGGTTASCKDVTDYTAFEQDLLGKNGMNLNCNSCHNSGGSGNAAFNMAGFATATNDPMSCATVLNYVNVATPNMSDIYLKISGGKSHQGGTLSTANQQTFLTALTKWLNGEK